MLLSNLVFAGLTIAGALASVFISASYYFHYCSARFMESHPTNGSEYDYIVVGSGSSGSVVAGRLAEAGHRILLVEAGGPSHFLQEVPALVAFFMGSEYDWKYELKPKENIAGIFKDRTIQYPRGYTLGGSSMLNWMLYFRGHSKDFEEWENLGNPGWGWRDVLPFFKKAERFAGTNEEVYGTDGNFRIMFIPYLYKIVDVMAAAFHKVGVPIGDVNSDKFENEGIWHSIPLALDNGARRGTFRGYVANNLNNIDVMTYSVASRLILDKTNSVRGINVERFGQELQYFASGEVILSAGAIGTPQLLMLSGIGPRKELKKYKIRQVADLPVGKNLQDHCMVMQSVRIHNPEGFMTMDATTLLNPVNFYEFYSNGTGQLTNNGMGVVGVMNTPKNRGKQRPDLQFHTAPFDFGVDLGATLRHVAKWNDTVWSHLHADHPFVQGIGVAPTLLRPKSRGSVTLGGPSINDPPIIDTNFLDHPDDVQTLVEGLKIVKKLEGTEAFKKYGMELIQDHMLCGDHLEPYTDDYYECFAREYLTTVYHPVGTCAMGPIGKKNSVVDHWLRVHSIGRLRVADASIMPRLVGANTNAVCVMIGEKAASMIIKDAKRSGKKKGRSEAKTEKGSKEEL